MKKFWIMVALLAVVALPLAACGGKKDKAEAAHNVQLGDKTVADHGQKDVSNASAIDIEADSYYFAPTFLQGKPGQKVTIKVENDSTTLHNFSLMAQGVDSDIQPKGDTEVQVTFPDSGALLFFCKYHSSQGMNGELLSGSATPQAPSGSAPAGGSTSSDSTY